MVPSDAFPVNVVRNKQPTPIIGYREVSSPVLWLNTTRCSIFLYTFNVGSFGFYFRTAIYKTGVSRSHLALLSGYSLFVTSSRVCY